MKSELDWYVERVRQMVGDIHLGYEAEGEDPAFPYTKPIEPEIEWLAAWLVSEGWVQQPTYRGSLGETRTARTSTSALSVDDTDATGLRRPSSGAPHLHKEGLEGSGDQSGPRTSKLTQRFPVVTAVFMAAAIVLPFIPSVIAGGTYAGRGMELFGPFVLGVIGAVLSLLHRSLKKDTRIGWAAVSVSTGFLVIPVEWFFLGWIFGP